MYRPAGDTRPNSTGRGAPGRPGQVLRRCLKRWPTAASLRSCRKHLHKHAPNTSVIFYRCGDVLGWSPWRRFSAVESPLAATSTCSPVPACLRAPGHPIDVHVHAITPMCTQMHSGAL